MNRDIRDAYEEFISTKDKLSLIIYNDNKYIIYYEEHDINYQAYMLHNMVGDRIAIEYGCFREPRNNELASLKIAEKDWKLFKIK